MKKLLFLILMGSLIACSTSKKSATLLEEDQLYLTRKYIGNFLEYCHTGPQIVGDKDLIWIKTTIYPTYGKISAYGKTCDFSVGDKIYLKPVSSTTGDIGNWVYQVENDFAINY